MAEARLSVAQRELVRRLILADRLGNLEIVERLAKEHGVTITPGAIGYYRRQLLPEIQASDLEAIQAGASVFVERFKRLSGAILALYDAAVDEQGKLKKPGKYSCLDLEALSKLTAEHTRLLHLTEDRILRRERLELEREKNKIDQDRLKLEQAREAREAERHAVNMAMTRRELALLEEEDKAAALGGVDDEGALGGSGGA